MQRELTAIGAPPTARVGGLGVCDALRVELDPVQLPWLVDAREEMRRPLEERLQRARAQDERRHDEPSTRELAEREYHLRLLRLMHARLAAPCDEQSTTFVGPSAMVADVVRVAMRNVTAELRDLADGWAGSRHEEHERLQRTAAAASAWVDTFLACEAVTSFNFDGDADPGRQW